MKYPHSLSSSAHMRPYRRGIAARPIRISQTDIALSAVAQAVPMPLSDICDAFAQGLILGPSGARLTASEYVKAGSVCWSILPAKDENRIHPHLFRVAENERWMIVDKPHGLSTMPRGMHVAHTATILARRQFHNSHLVAAHRLDADTAGLLLFSKAQKWRRPYHDLFAHRSIHKTYRVIAPDFSFCEIEKIPGVTIVDDTKVDVAIHIDKKEGIIQAQRVADREPNSFTCIEKIAEIPHHAAINEQAARMNGTFMPLALYNVYPSTGKTHQIRLSFLHVGAPIVGDRMYPRIRYDEHFSLPLQLLAWQLEFTDPLDHQHKKFISRRTLAWWI